MTATTQEKLCCVHDSHVAIMLTRDVLIEERPHKRISMVSVAFNVQGGSCREDGSSWNFHR